MAKRKKLKVKSGKLRKAPEKGLDELLGSIVGEREGLPFEPEPYVEAPPPVRPLERPAVPKIPKAPLVVPEAKPPKAREVVDTYGQVEILTVKDEAVPLYRLKLPKLTPQERRLSDSIKEKAIDEIKIDPERISDPAERERVFLREVLKIVQREGRGLSLPPERLKRLAELIVRDMIGYGPLDLVVSDDSLEDILVTGINRPVYVYHRKYGMCRTNVIFDTEEAITHIIDKMAHAVGRHIDQQTPLLDARLPDGSRVNATIQPVSLEGPTLSIRKFRKDPLSIIDILGFNTLSTDVAAFLWLITDGLGVKPANIIFAGGTGCGKTTMLNAATTFVPDRERIISIEDTAELQLPHRHWIRLETRPPNVEGRGEVTMDDLTKNALRMRPDRIIVGEVRGPEAKTMFTAMNTGHDGCCGTVHSNSAMETITRLTKPPMDVSEIMIPALDVICMQQRMYHRKKGQIRRITEVAEVTGIEAGKVQLSRIYKWNPRTDEVEPTGVPSQIKRTIADFSGLSGSALDIELKRRAVVFEWMKEKGIRNIFDGGKTIQEYYQNPEAVLKRIHAKVS